MAETVTYFVDKKASSWGSVAPKGSTSRICNEFDFISGIPDEEAGDYWEFDMVTAKYKTYSFVISMEQLYQKSSGEVPKNYGDPDVGQYTLTYTKSTASGHAAKWVLTDPQDDGCKLVVRQATWKSWIEHYPIFTILITGILVGIFVYYAKDDCQDPLTECPTFSNFALAYRVCCREQLWRWFTYSLMHANVRHIVGNLFMLAVLTGPLEMVHGSWRIMALYVIGALAGSLGSSVFDPNSNVVGASGACYMYLGAWVADMASNFDSKDSVWACCNGGIFFGVNSAGKYIQVLVVTLWTFTDLGMQVYDRYTTESNVSFAGHFAGFFAGVAFGSFILKNESRQVWEMYTRWAGISVYVCGMILAIVWNVYFTYDPYKACADDEYAKCNLTKNYAI